MECPATFLAKGKCLLPVFLRDGSHGHPQSNLLIVFLVTEGVLGHPHLALLQENVSLQRKNQTVNTRRQIQRNPQDSFSVNEWVYTIVTAILSPAPRSTFYHLHWYMGESLGERLDNSWW